MKPWDGVISEQDQKATYAAGFGRPSSIGKRPALLIIDVQYRTIGTTPKPILESIKEFPTSCGEIGWNAMRNIALLLAARGGELLDRLEDRFRRGADGAVLHVDDEQRRTPADGRRPAEAGGVRRLLVVLADDAVPGFHAAPSFIRV